MNSDYTQGDYTHLDGPGSVDPTVAELKEMHEEQVVRRLKKATASEIKERENKKRRSRGRTKMAKASRRRSRGK